MKIPKTFFHVDGDAFFAACEQATTLHLRGKPIVVGYERGAATAMSYEAKKLGVVRGSSVRDIQREFPTVTLVSSDYKKYALYSNRFKALIERHYTDKVEKTSIDECYVDVTGLDVSLKKSFPQIAQEMAEMLHEKLGITFSIGIGPTKTIAKIGSGMNKPHGITDITTSFLERRIYPLSIEKVPGIGARMSVRMRDKGIFTIGMYTEKTRAYVENEFARPYQALWSELRGDAVQGLEKEREAPQSISKVHAFNTHTSDPNFLCAELSRHCEVITTKLRRHNRVAYKVSCGLKTFEKMYRSREIISNSPLYSAEDVYKLVHQLFNEVHDPSIRYRATYVVISGIKPLSKQSSFLEITSEENQKKVDELNDVVDLINIKKGKMMIRRASSQINVRDKIAHNATPLIYSESGRKILDIPFCC